ncbi:MAG: Protease DegQ [Microgenomates group bacterium GW2011_GWC1_37_8]|uniref:Protease DegQ n=1 Tax=Candidatus Woesebacteria bacterium GW2011_GWB1_38_8 TaxID=1618570 RepID=A0A0G0NJ51_9BACT|nr:MAG: Protease DegQ [Microgenomates group bacterium GW2011_GWC1_37_8]KKQ85949.1 MAG: Protease DegQ [Candidatus Woesebacteria bacterium GW2011_GWB1_38_8]
MKRFNFKAFLIGIAVVLVLLGTMVSGAIADRLFVIKPLDLLLERADDSGLQTGNINQRILTEESAVIDVADKMSSSVVTVSVQTPRRRVLQFSPFGGIQQRIEGGQPQDIGSGFIVTADGLIVTNKHVVSDTSSTYKVVTKDGKEHEVKQISRDPSNDIAVLKIDPSAGSGQALQPVELGDSSNLKVGQFVIAIGTALGEFRHTVTTGVISGLGRGITAGSAFEGFVERLDDVIQTDAAINPGNSGGPLLNSAGQVIGVNVAVAQGAENIGFAIPVNIVKDALDQFQKTGKFTSRAYLGVEYQMLTKQSALMNEVPQGALVINVVDGSPAATAGIQPDDIIVKLDGQKLSDLENGLADAIKSKKAGDKVSLEVWRNEETLNLSAILSEFSE